MSPSQWEQVKDWFERLSEAPREERDRALAELEDRVVAEEARRLLNLNAESFNEVDRLQPPVEWVKDVVDLRAFRKDDVAAERFRIVRFIAAGGMGEVYEAEDAALNERVAVKTLRPELALTDTAFARFKQEIQLSRRVTHPNVCRIHDLWQHRAPGGRTVHFLTMELLEGETLAARLERDGKLAPEVALGILRQMVEGLEAAHAAGVVHRDLKPSNVMMVGERVVITDFGLSRSLSAVGLTATGGALGTPAYMAPEQIEGGEIGPATDVYSLGVLLYELVTGVLPFRGGSAMALAVKKLRETPAPPSSLVEGLPASWDRGILGCLAQDAGARFQSARAVLAEVEGSTRTALPRKKKLLGTWQRTAAMVGIAVVVSLLPWRGLWSGHRPTAEAQRWYDRGVTALHEEAPYQARLLLEKAVAADPQFPGAHARLAQALAELDMADRAREALLRADGLRDEPGGLTDAVRHFVLRDFGESAKLFARLGAGLDTAKALAMNGAVDEAIARYEGLVKAEPENAAAWLQLGVLRHRLRQWSGALEAYGKAEEVFRLRGNLEGLTAVALRRSETLILTKDLARSEEDLRGVMEMARATKYEYLEAVTLARLGTVAARGGKFGEAREIAGKVGAMARGVGYSQLQAHSYFDLGYAYHAQFKYEEALEAYLTSLRIAEEERLQRAAAGARLRVAEVLVRLKRGGEALEYLRAAEEYYRTTRDPQSVLTARMVRVDAQIAEGKNEEAWREARASYEEVVKSGRAGEVAPVLLRVAHLAIVRGDFLLVFEIQAQVRGTFERLRQKGLLVRLLLNEMELRIHSGDFKEARKLRAEAVGRIAELGADGKTELQKLQEKDTIFAIAEERAEEALRLVREVPKSVGLTRAQLETEALLLAGRAREAEDLATRTVREMNPKEDVTDRTAMRCVLARTQIAATRFGAAAETARGALAEGGDASKTLIRLRCAIVLQKALEGAKDAGAAEARVRARRELETFTAGWPTEFKSMFLNRPDMRRYLTEEK